MNEVMMQQSGELMGRNTQTEMMISRQAQEVQAAMVIAKRWTASTGSCGPVREDLLQRAPCMNTPEVEQR